MSVFIRHEALICGDCIRMRRKNIILMVGDVSLPYFFVYTVIKAFFRGSISPEKQSLSYE